MHKSAVTTAAARAVALAASLSGAAAAERLVMTKVSQLFLPFETGSDGVPRFCFDKGVAEQLTYHAPTQQAIVCSSESLQLVDMRNVSAPELVATVELPAGTTDVETCGTMAAASLENPDAAVLPGSVKIFTITAGGLEEKAEVTVGALPDMLTFTPDCSMILTANEGEAGEDPDGTFVNPEGSVSIISVAGALAGEEGAVREATFTKFNDQAEELVAQGVRWVWRGQGFPDPSAFPEQTFAKDIEPEYIALSKDGKTAFVVLQENNAIATVDIAAAEVTGIQPLAFKAWADIGARSDLERGNGASLQPWNTFGAFQPDTIVSFSVNGKEYLAIANEGDTKEYELTADVEWTEEADAPDIADAVNASLPAFFAEPVSATAPMTLAEALAETLEDLTVSEVDGGPRSIAGEAVTAFEKVITFSGRSFSILEVLEGGKLAMVYDSGQELEARHHTHWPQLHNMDFPDGFCAPNPAIAQQLAEAEDPEALFLEIAASGVYEDFAEEEDGEIEVPDFVVSNLAGEQDRRSARKGPETEAVAFAEVGGRPVLFVANERSSTVFLYDISVPTRPVYQDSVYGGPVDSSMTFHQLYEARMVGEVDPESLAVIKAADSPTGKDLLIIAGSVSGSLGVYEIGPEEAPAAEPVPDFPCERSESGPKVISVARALGVTLADINPGAAFPTSAPTPFTSHTPAPGTFAVPGDADAAAAVLSVPQYGTSDVLSGADCRGRGETEICFDTPGLFSGFTGPLAWCKQPNSFGVFGLGSESDGTTCPFGNGAGVDQGLLFMGMTDRGPNQGCDDVSGLGIAVSAESLELAGSKGFPVPDFSPAMTFLELNSGTGALELLKACPLRGVDGSAVTGVSNNDGIDVPFTKDCGAALGFAPSGMDTEEVQPIGSSGWCLLVEEFSPSVAVVRCDPRGDGCGTVHTRYVPEGSDVPQGDAYNVVASLPSELAFRIPNRGLETIVVSPDGATAFAFMQSPLLDSDAAEPTTNTTALRVLRLAIGDASSETTPPEVTVEAMHVYSFDAFPLWDDADSNRRVLVLVAERSRGQVKLYDADFAAAADLLQSDDRNGDPAALTPELLYNDGAVPVELAPAAKELVVDSLFIDGWAARGVSAKQEGVALVNSCVVALAEDNDFGLEGQPVSSVTFVQLDRCLPRYSGGVYDVCVRS